jgi:hypothetical protein
MSSTFFDALFETEQFAIFDQVIYFLSILALNELTDFASTASDGSVHSLFCL